MDVQIRCVCPTVGDAVRHGEGDTVVLPEILGFQTVMTLSQSVGTAKALASRLGDGISIPEMMAVLMEAYLLYTIERWTLVDEAGKAVPLSKHAVQERLMPHFAEAQKVAEQADALYTERYLLPLLFGASTPSPATRSQSSTSAPTNGRTPRKPSKRSSTTTSPMVVTGPMAASPAGASSS